MKKIISLLVLLPSLVFGGGFSDGVYPVTSQGNLAIGNGSSLPWGNSYEALSLGASGSLYINTVTGLLALGNNMYATDSGPRLVESGSAADIEIQQGGVQFNIFGTGLANMYPANLGSVSVTGGGNLDTTGYINTDIGYNLNGAVTQLAASPSIASGFGTGALIVKSNGTAFFQLNTGTGGTAYSGVIAMPAAVRGWACTVSPRDSPQAGAATYSSATSATSITLTNYALSTGLSLAWPATSIFLNVTCTGF